MLMRDTENLSNKAKRHSLREFDKNKSTFERQRLKFDYKQLLMKKKRAGVCKVDILTHSDEMSAGKMQHCV